MIVKDIMRKNVIVAKPDVTLREASKVMSQFQIGSLIITERKKILGILTERNVLSAVAKGKNPELVTAEEIMAKNVITIEPDKNIEEAVELMVKNRIKKLPVVKDDKLIGIVTASDIIVVESKLIESIASLVSIKLPAYRGG